jgi:hypothetical protein
MQMFVKSQPNIVIHHEKMGRGEARVLKTPTRSDGGSPTQLRRALTIPARSAKMKPGIASILFRSACNHGPVAQLGARFHGMEEVVGSIPTRSTIFRQADVAQLVEQPIRNRQVSGSSPLVGSISNLPDVSARCSEWRSTFEAQPRISEKFVPLPPHCRDGTEPRRWP